jgi:hypothetical protein
LAWKIRVFSFNRGQLVGLAGKALTRGTVQVVLALDPAGNYLSKLYFYQITNLFRISNQVHYFQLIILKDVLHQLMEFMLK